MVRDKSVKLFMARNALAFFKSMIVSIITGAIFFVPSLITMWLFRNVMVLGAVFGVALTVMYFFVWGYFAQVLWGGWSR